MIQLTKEEQDILDGREGRLRQTALENIVRYAQVLGAEKLCKVTKATVFCGNHNYLNVCECGDFHDVFTRMNLARDERIVFDSVDKDCYVQSCVAASDQFDYEIFDQPKEEFDKNSYYLEESRKAGVTIAGSCSPYLMGWLPLPTRG